MNNMARVKLAVAVRDKAEHRSLTNPLRHLPSSVTRLGTEQELPGGCFMLIRRVPMTSSSGLPRPGTVSPWLHLAAPRGTQGGGYLTGGTAFGVGKLGEVTTWKAMKCALKTGGGPVAPPVAPPSPPRITRRTRTPPLTWTFLSALGGSRTPNLLIRSQTLYPLGYERNRHSLGAS